MKILLISGTYPPESCGIGDYTAKLVLALRELSFEVEVLANLDWSIVNYFKISKQIIDINPNVIHIQYPSVGYGASLVPQLLSLRFKTVVTIHEVLQARMIRKLSLLPFSIKPKLIFTNEFEKLKFQKLFPWNKWFNTSTIIPIGSNISRINSGYIANKNINTIITFGLIRPNKGLEDTLKLAVLIKENGLPYKVMVIGQVLPKFEAYFKSLRNLSNNLLDWKINLPEDEVGDILARHSISYMPFPDGVSERRGSLLAVMANDMLIFTTKGKHTTSEISDVVVFTSSPNDFVKLLKETPVDSLLQKWQSKINSSKKYIEKLSWDNIAKLHKDYYATHNKRDH